MDIDQELSASKINRANAVNLIPARLIEQEDKLFSRVEISKKNSISKLGDLYEFVDNISRTFQHLTPCKKGCSFCCHIRVDVSDLEVRYIKKHAKKEVKNLPRKLVIGEPCPFLKNNACSIYAVRPFACRSLQVFTPTNKLCMPDQNHKVEQLRFTEIDKSFRYIISEHDSGEFNDIRKVFEPK